MQETTQYGSTIQRESTPFSISGFEAQLGSEWSYLTSVDPSHHSVHINRRSLQLITFCEGDVVIKTAPDIDTFVQEQMEELSFAARH